MAETLEARVRPVIEPQLEAGEDLTGICVATQQSTFRGRMVVIGVTRTRLVLQPVDRKLKPSEQATSLTPDRIAEAKAVGAGNEWYDVTTLFMSGAAVTLRLKTTDGEKLKLTLMRGTGAFGKLGGDETQRLGVEALASWFAANAA